MRRRRYQKGSLQLRKHGGRRVWVVLYYLPDGKRGYHTLGLASSLKKADAQTAAADFMREANGGERHVGQPRPLTMKEFLEEIYLPFYGGKWKGSTKMTTEQRLRQHILGDLGQVHVSALGTC